MDYEKKYKETLEKAKKLYGKYCINNVLEDLFPELKESEDERIRKAIIEFFELQDDNTTYSFVPKKDIIAWLEKQGEKKPAENVEIKFREGDKIVSNQDGKVYTVGTTYWVTGNNICLHGTDGNHKWTNKDDLDKNYHLWTSEDAKPLDADKVIEWLKNTIRETKEYFGEDNMFYNIRLTLPYNYIEDLINDFKENFRL